MSNGNPVSTLVYRAFRGDEVIVLSPETSQRMGEKGTAITVKPELPPEEAINKIFEFRHNKAKENALKLLPYPDCDEEILCLYDHIGQCILFDMPGAAITFCGILIEYALKRATFISETSNRVEFDSQKWEEFEKITLKPAIKRAREAGLIDDNEAEKLREFTDEVRNPYAHFNLQKITKGMVFGNAVEMNLKTGQAEDVDIPVSRSPVYMALAKENVDTKSVATVFSFCDKIVRSLWVQLPAR